MERLLTSITFCQNVKTLTLINFNRVKIYYSQSIVNQLVKIAAEREVNLHSVLVVRVKNGLQFVVQPVFFLFFCRPTQGAFSAGYAEDLRRTNVRSEIST